MFSWVQQFAILVCSKVQTKTISALSALSNTDCILNLWQEWCLWLTLTWCHSWQNVGQRVLYSNLNAYKRCWLPFSCSGCRLSVRRLPQLSKCLLSTSFTLEGSVSVKGVEMRGSVIEAHFWLMTEMLRIFWTFLSLSLACFIFVQSLLGETLLKVALTLPDSDF